MPPAVPLPGSGNLGPMPHVFLDDAAFPLKDYLMRPFPGVGLPVEQDTYRHSRARMAIECTFGILSSRWRVLLTHINLDPKNVDYVVTACCILHNFLHSQVECERWLIEASESGQVMDP